MRTSRRPYLFMLVAVHAGGGQSRRICVGQFLYTVTSCLRAIRGIALSQIRNERKRIARAAGVFLAVSLLIAWSAWPAEDNQFVKHLNLSAAHIC